jgi:NAD(P)-dependent dehydrogenase (short-subunit alcohol dehydrogenase family)
MRGLKDKVALVTGGLGDLGYASIVRLVEEGCQVASFDLKTDDEKKLSALGVFHQSVDISKELRGAFRFPRCRGDSCGMERHPLGEHHRHDSRHPEHRAADENRGRR